MRSARTRAEPLLRPARSARRGRARPGVPRSRDRGRSRPLHKRGRRRPGGRTGRRSIRRGDPRPARPSSGPLAAAPAGVVEAGLDHPDQGEAGDRGDSDRHRRALADEIAGVADDVVDALVADPAGEARDCLGGAMGVIAIILAESLVDRAGGVVDHRADLLEQAGHPALAVVGEAAGALGRLAAGVGALARTLLTSPSGPQPPMPAPPTEPAPARAALPL